MRRDLSQSLLVPLHADFGFLRPTARVRSVDGWFGPGLVQAFLDGCGFERRSWSIRSGTRRTPAAIHALASPPAHGSLDVQGRSWAGLAAPSVAHAHAYSPGRLEVPEALESRQQCAPSHRAMRASRRRVSVDRVANPSSLEAWIGAQAASCVCGVAMDGGLRRVADEERRGSTPAIRTGVSVVTGKNGQATVITDNVCALAR